VTQLLDTNVLIRHFSGAPAGQAAAASAFLSAARPRSLRLTDVHLAELVWVLESSIYRADRSTITAVVDSVLSLPAIEVTNEAVLQETLRLYSQRLMDWTDAYLVASARISGVSEVVSFDRFDSRLAGLEVRRVRP